MVNLLVGGGSLVLASVALWLSLSEKTYQIRRTINGISAGMEFGLAVQCFFNWYFK